MWHLDIGEERELRRVHERARFLVFYFKIFL